MVPVRGHSIENFQTRSIHLSLIKTRVYDKPWHVLNIPHSAPLKFPFASPVRSCD